MGPHKAVVVEVVDGHRALVEFLDGRRWTVAMPDGIEIAVGMKVFVLDTGDKLVVAVTGQ
jgi:hypothetical protein